MGTLSRYKKEAKIAEANYKDIGSVICPFFKRRIAFTSDGFHHLKFSGEREREKLAQLHKFKFINAAKEIIEKSGTVQEYRKIWGAVGSRRFSSGLRDTKEMQFWGFVGILGEGDRRVRVKAIVRQVGSGEPHFWSVMCETTLKNKSSFKLASDDISTQ